LIDSNFEFIISFLRALNFSKLSGKSCNYGLFKVNFWGSGGITPSVKRGYAKFSLVLRRKKDEVSMWVYD